MRQLLLFLLVLVGAAMFVTALVIGALVDGLSDGQQGCLIILGIGGAIVGASAMDEL